jgi:hypothetical protein
VTQQPEDLAALLAAANIDRRDEINAQTAPFVGRISVHVDLDANVVMRSVQIRVRPCADACGEDDR